MGLTRVDFQRLLSQEVFLEGMAANDVRSLWRRLRGNAVVEDIDRRLCSDPQSIRELCEFVSELLNEEYDTHYRHPDDMAICAALVVLERSPISHARNLFSRLQTLKERSLVWVQRIAEYCDARFVPCDCTRIVLQRAGPADGTTILLVGACIVRPGAPVDASDSTQRIVA
ncbi:hypothetical protein LCGC14_2158880 [marine sediment metagenome]|uniref:Uncharacterized protein n=1 Tax=marine sediment metagenome TaxID=412755 RepID=A0A0F9GPF4_9ZZZZ